MTRDQINYAGLLVAIFAGAAVVIYNPRAVWQFAVAIAAMLVHGIT